MRLLVTGGAGFIGSAFVRHLVAQRPEAHVVTLDKLTYAGNLENLASLDGHPRHHFVHGDICDGPLVRSLLQTHGIGTLVHFAAESHVDRSILAPDAFIETNVRGTATLLDAARATGLGRFLLVSTDEVYGDIDAPLEADERFPLRPSSPYAASKAAADLLALSYVRTYGLPVVITRASNTYGPYQFPEKLIPLMIANALEGLPLPVYGDGLQVRDWLFVEDHCRGILAALERGRDGEVYNIGGHCALPNRVVIERILDRLGAPPALMQTVADRAGHDRRYALDCGKIARDTGFVPEVPFDAGLARTIAWYREHEAWTNRVRSGEYREYYRKNYAWRATAAVTGAASAPDPRSRQ
jgi:dTDP-glucose 4,6-dehydratase